MIQAYLGLGSNIGDRESQLNDAIKILNEYDGINVSNISPIYETAPVGYTEQPNFLNLCFKFKQHHSITTVGMLFEDRRMFTPY